MPTGNSKPEPPRLLNRHRLVDLFVLLLLAGLVALYAADAVRASRSIYNLILVLPVSGLVLALCLVQFIAGVPRVRSAEQEREPVTDIVPVVVLFAAYVLSLHWLGFDLGTTLFLGVFLWLHGERRWVWLLAYSMSFGFLVSLFFSMMLPYPMPMTILSTQY